jgi:hypothetical protein
MNDFNEMREPRHSTLLRTGARDIGRSCIRFSVYFYFVPTLRGELLLPDSMLPSQTHKRAFPLGTRRIQGMSADVTVQCPPSPFIYPSP